MFRQICYCVNPSYTCEYVCVVVICVLCCVVVIMSVRLVLRRASRVTLSVLIINIMTYLKITIQESGSPHKPYS